MVFRSAQLQSQDNVLVLARVHLRVIAVTSTPSAQPFQNSNLHSPHGLNSRSSVLADISLPAAQRKRLVQERIAVDIADSPVHDSRIRGRSKDELGRFGSPVPVVLGDSQAVADADDVGGPVAAEAFDFEGSGGGFGAVDVGDVDRFCAVVEDELGGDGVGGVCEGEDCSCGEGGEVHVGRC